MVRSICLPLICAGLLSSPVTRAQEAVSASYDTTVILGKDGQHAVEGINAFSLDLYKREVKPEKNLFLSPASVSVAVGLAYRGAVGPTAQQLAQTLHFDAPPAEYLRADSQLLAAMNLSGEGRQLQSANAVWVQSGMPLHSDFEADITHYAKAGFQRVDFAGDAEGARGTINHWVEVATHDKISDLLHPGDLEAGTAAVLVNAIYWKGKWRQPFDEAETRSDPFTLADNSTVTTKLMHLDYQDFAVLHRNGVKAISLPYEGGEVSMVVLLPDSPHNLSRFEESLTWPDLRRWLFDLKGGSEQRTLLTLPKLHLDWRSDLKDDLKEMGAPIAFGDDADFSGIAKLPYPGGNPRAIGLKISHVIHQTTIDVEEKDTEAAAATAVEMGMIVTSARRGPPPPPPFVFKADHPFLFVLVDNRTDMILFIGRYVNPAQAQ